jgi:methionyl-tRNA formyltransferase
MKIIFFGANDIGYDCCKKLIENKEEIIGLFSIPQKFKISYSKNKINNVRFSDFNYLSKKYKIPLYYYKSSKENEMVKTIKNLKPDIIIVIGWYYMISKEIRQIPPKGVIGIHASLLPKYRGGAPLNWAIINGEKETGISLFYFKSGVDNGDLIGQKKIKINDIDTIKEIINKASKSSIQLLEEMIPKIKNNTAPRIKQNENDATYFPQRSPTDGKIDWSWNSKKIKDFIRAQTKPYPGAFTKIQNKKIIIWDADIIETKK